MEIRHFREPESIENNICIGTAEKYSIVMDEIGQFYYYNNQEHQLEIGEAVSREYITSIDVLPCDEREVVIRSIYNNLL